MGFWDKSLRIFNSLCENATQSVRHLAQQTGLSKSSVHRLQQAMERRNGHPESWLWETADGRRWLTRLVVAALYTFGLKRGVGLETISEFFTHLPLETQVGCSPSALGGVMQALEAAIVETTAVWEHDGVATGEMREISGAVEETFLQRMMLVFMDLVSGYLLFAEVAEDRTYATWYTLAAARFKLLGSEVLSLGSDRAKALMKLAATGLGCLSLEVLVETNGVPVKKKALDKVRTQLVGVCVLVDFWWQGVWQDVQHIALTPMWKRWVAELLLPLLYGQQQVARMRGPRRKAKILQALKAMQAAFETHPITQQLAPDILSAWQAWAAERAKTFQRASSAVEGRNGSLAQMHHHHRGVPKRRCKVWTVLHNFDCRASDGTTPASRFFRRSCPDLFETVLSPVGDLPRPRKRDQAMVLSD